MLRLFLRLGVFHFLGEAGLLVDVQDVAGGDP
jgi:hypothetical protein